MSSALQFLVGTLPLTAMILLTAWLTERYLTKARAEIVRNLSDLQGDFPARFHELRAQLDRIEQKLDYYVKLAGRSKPPGLSADWTETAEQIRRRAGTGKN